jgi:hypothetical protein
LQRDAPRYKTVSLTLEIVGQFEDDLLPVNGVVVPDHNARALVNRLAVANLWIGHDELAKFNSLFFFRSLPSVQSLIELFHPLGWALHGFLHPFHHIHLLIHGSIQLVHGPFFGWLAAWSKEGAAGQTEQSPKGSLHKAVLLVSDMSLVWTALAHCFFTRRAQPWLKTPGEAMALAMVGRSTQADDSLRFPEPTGTQLG